MRARVFVTLKPSVFDPQGKTIADALHSLGYGGVEDVRQGKYFELELVGRFEREGPDDGVGSRRQAAGESGDRELSHRGGVQVSDEFAVIVFPGIELRPRRVSRGEGRARPGRGVRLAQGNRPSRRGCGDSARRVFARRLPADRRHCAVFAGDGRGEGFAAAGGPVLGICNGFQILLEAGMLPGAMLRNRGLKFRVRARARARRTDRHPVHAGVPAAAGAAHADRSWRRQLLHDARRAAAARTEPADRVPVRQRRRRGYRRGESERLARVDRGHLQRAAECRRA